MLGVFLSLLHGCSIDQAMDDFDEAGSFQRLGRHREAIERYSYVVTRYPESELAFETCSQAGVAGAKFKAAV